MKHTKKHPSLAKDDLESYISEVKSVFQKADFGLKGISRNYAPQIKYKAIQQELDSLQQYVSN